MKRIITSIFISICVFFLFPIGVQAETSTTYYFDEFGISIDIPEDFFVYTREICESEPDVSYYQDMLNFMQTNSIYMEAFNVNNTHEFVITAVAKPGWDFTTINDSLFETMINLAQYDYVGTNITYLKAEAYQHEQIKFIKVYICQPVGEDTMYSLQYYTIFNGIAMNFTYHSYYGELSVEDETLLQSIVDGVVFDVNSDEPIETVIPEVVETTPSFIYTDDESGVTFTVPENWIETPMTEERETLDVKFTSNLKDGLTIIFSSQDVYEMGISEAPNIHSRSDVNNSILTKADVAEICGCLEQNVSMVSYGGSEYFCAEYENVESVYGLTINIPMVYLMRLENGWMYTFQYGGEKGSEYFDDFTNLVSSVKYPAVKSEFIEDMASKPIESQPTEEQGVVENKPGRTDIEVWDEEEVGLFFTNFAEEYSKLIIILLCTQLVLIIYILPIIVYRYGIRKQRLEKKRAGLIAGIYSVCASILVTVLGMIIVSSFVPGISVLLCGFVNYCLLVEGKKNVTKEKKCRFCGTEMAPDAPFCDKCGAVL